MQELCLKEDTGSKTGKRGEKLKIKVTRQDGISVRPDGKKNRSPEKWPGVRTVEQSVLTGSRLGSPGKWPSVRTGELSS